MKGNWLALNRQIFDHPWLTQRTEWAWAWVVILGLADFQTGEVVLTQAYRELSDFFTHNQWRHFVSKLAKDDMLENLKTINAGHHAGHIQTARIKNWEVYQPDKIARSQQHSQHGARNTASTEPTTAQDDNTETSARSQHGARNTASTEPTTELIKKDLKKLKKLKEDPPLPPLTESRAAEPAGEEILSGFTGENHLQKLARHAPGIADALERMARLQRQDKIPLKLAQAEALLKLIDERGAEAVERSLRTILATAGDGGGLFRRALAHLEKQPKPQATPGDHATEVSGADLLDLDVPLNGTWGAN